MTSHLLSLQSVETSFATRGGLVRAVNDVTLDIGRGEILGLVGESGSGKSVTGFSVLGLVEPPGRVTSGRILFDGDDLLGLAPSQVRKLRGKRIAMIFQDPMMTLNPVMRVGAQMIDAVLAHDRVPRAEARARARDALATVGIPSPEERLDAYPHQLSGGMRQRVAIAIAILHRPDLIIADEPTTALDVTIQSQILVEVQKLTRDNHMALMWISHDLSVVARLADRVAVMYAGRIVEQGPIEEVIGQPRHPYTLGLIRSLPGQTTRGQRLTQIPGTMPSLANLPSGCAFRDRCFRAAPDCAEAPPPEIPAGSQGHSLRCFHPLEGGDA